MYTIYTGVGDLPCFDSVSQSSDCHTALQMKNSTRSTPQLTQSLQKIWITINVTDSRGKPLHITTFDIWCCYQN